MNRSYVATLMILLPLLSSCASQSDEKGEMSRDGFESVTLNVTGGLLPIDRDIRLLPSGEVTVVSRGREAKNLRHTVDASAVANIRSLISSAAFRTLQPSYVPRDTCCDRMTYTLTVVRASGQQTVATLDGVPWPETLELVIGRMQELAAGK